MPHLLKRLELNGFKSFAGKTVLEFPHGITAIVGPNGSGKSNVVDAVRWLLGEREAKNLRGAKVEDLIFSGTPKRPRVGQAQASLHFENENNFFPSEYSEITISRQVNRDGVGQYFLNRSEILLRDLIDFYAKVRLGARGLVVVTQGNSDMFISASPSERRGMIEEMLGLREYQIKKADGERRLKTSLQNLEKVRALIEEIVPHLRSLKRQTGRWEKRGELEAELLNHEKIFFGSQLSQIEGDMARVASELAGCEARQGVLRHEIEDAKEYQASIEAKEPEGRQELRRVKEVMARLFQTQGELQKELGRLEARFEIEQKSSAGAKHPAFDTDELVRLTGRVKEILESALAGDSDHLKKSVEQAISHLNSFFTKKSSSNPAHTDTHPEALQDLKNVQMRLAEIVEKVNTEKKKEQELEAGQEGFYAVFKSAVSRVEEAKAKIDEWERERARIVFEKEKLELRRGEVFHQIRQSGHVPEAFAGSDAIKNREDLNELERRIYKMRGELAAIGEVDVALLREAGETQERYDFLVQQSADLEKAVSDTRGIIRELKEKIHVEFSASLVKINHEFEKFFGVMFGGGQAKLKLESRIKNKELKGDAEEEDKKMGDGEEKLKDDEDEEPGVEIVLSLPRKRAASLDILSGGEKSLVGIAALFALISVSPPPFLVLDEIDAPLDERNARRFAQMLKEFSKHTQFIIVTHNRATMEAADVLYGVTLDEDGTSKIVSLKFSEGSAVPIHPT